MSEPAMIKRIGEVPAVQLLVVASERDAFKGQQLFASTLPRTFPYGSYRTLLHTCAQCGQQVEVAFTYGKQLLASSDLSRQGFNENKPWLNAVGTLFGLRLHHERDANGFESYLYLAGAAGNEGALLDVAYYRCAHCQAQYLALYQVQLKDQRPPFEPDEIRFERIFQVVLDHTAFLSVLNPAALLS